MAFDDPRKEEIRRRAAARAAELTSNIEYIAPEVKGPFAISDFLATLDKDSRRIGKEYLDQHSV